MRVSQSNTKFHHDIHVAVEQKVKFMQGSAETAYTGKEGECGFEGCPRMKKCLNRRHSVSLSERLWKLLAFVLRYSEWRSGMRFRNENEEEVIVWIYEVF